MKAAQEKIAESVESRENVCEKRKKQQKVYANRQPTAEKYCNTCIYNS